MTKRTVLMITLGVLGLSLMILPVSYAKREWTRSRAQHAPERSQAVGTNYATHSFTIASGGPGAALDFDGANDYVVLNRPVQDDFTIGFWMKTTQTGGSESQWWQGLGLVDSEVPGVANDFGISLANGKVVFGVGNPDVSINSNSTLVNNGLWHYITATRNKITGALVLYVDGAA